MLLAQPERGIMYTFVTHVCCDAADLPKAYVNMMEQEEGDPYEPDEEIPDIEVEVEYEPGWEQAGCRSGHPDNWTPDEGENPEIITVTITGEKNYDIEDVLSKKELSSLVAEAWKDQEGRAEDDFDPPDDYDDDGGYYRP